MLLVWKAGPGDTTTVRYGLIVVAVLISPLNLGMAMAGMEIMAVETRTSSSVVHPMMVTANTARLRCGDEYRW